jgi:hypothetical protein
MTYDGSFWHQEEGFLPGNPKMPLYSLQQVLGFSGGLPSPTEAYLGNLLQVGFLTPTEV